ncbi:hypothetical protein N7540_012176 [Penicillium herquei]|nr:hypothetical protein N7540_012176 [Penicillium herquei]
MRFHLATLGAALYATTAICAIVNLEVVNGTSCILSMKNFGNFTGTSDTLGTYYPNNNTCSDYDSSISAYRNSIPQSVNAKGSQGYTITYYFYPYNGEPMGTVAVEAPYYNMYGPSAWHSRINPHLIGVAQNVSVLNDLPPGW